MRTRSGGSPSTAAVSSRSRYGAWVQARITSVSPSSQAAPASGSMQACSTKAVRKAPATTWADPARAAAASPRRTRPSISRLPGRSGWTGGASGASAAAGSIQRRQRRPGDRETGQVAVGAVLEGHQRHRLAAEAHLGLGERRLVGEAGDHPEAVAPGDVGGGEDGRDPRPGRRPGCQVAEAEGGVGVRRAHRLQHQPAGAPDVGAEGLAARRPWRGRRGAAAGRRPRRRPPAAPRRGARRRRRRPRRRSCGSRCSGRARRRAPPRPRPAPGRGTRAISALAAISMPGVQMPHCAAPWRRNAACSRASPAPASPSTVVTARPATRAAGVRQAQTGWPSTSTVQAPQSPASQPTLVPVSPASSRSTSESRRVGRSASKRGVCAVQSEAEAGAVQVHRAPPASARSARRSSSAAAVGAVAGIGAHVVDRSQRRRHRRCVDPAGQPRVGRRADQPRLQRRQPRRHRAAGADRQRRRGHPAACDHDPRRDHGDRDHQVPARAELQKRRAAGGGGLRDEDRGDQLARPAVGAARRRG